jgi:hypothetical protein
MAGNLVAKVLSDPPARAKVESILESAADRVACMVLEHRTTLITIADGLCDLDELSGDQINQIVTAALPA